MNKQDFIDGSDFRKFKMGFFKMLEDFLLDKPSNNFIDYLSRNQVTKKEVYNILDIKNTGWSKARKKQKIINSLATPDWNDLSDEEDSEEELKLFDYEKDNPSLNASFSGIEEAYDSDTETKLLGEDFYNEIQK